MGNSINLKDFIENISYNKNQTYTRVEVLDEISKCLLNYCQTYSLVNCINLLRIIKADMKALESISR